MRHLITLADVSPNDIQSIFAICTDLKSKLLAGTREPLLPGRVMALLFEKPSLRTRVSFEACMTHLGGGSLMLGDDAGFGKRESVADFTRVLSAMVDVIVVRSKAHRTVEQVAKYASCAVINGLTDEAHPCQALADLLTIREHFGDLAGRKLAWVGDANNVAKSLARACARTGMQMSLACPAGYEFDDAFMAELDRDTPDFKLHVTTSAHEAVAGACAIYTDVWASMGQEAEQEQRKLDFANFQVDSALMQAAEPDAVFMHCLPARRGEEVTDEVIDSPQSIVVAQAANRLHAQKGVLVWLLATKN